MAKASLQFHPLAAMFPPMEGEEFNALVADIKANGVQSKIVLYQGKILDGRNRYRAILALKYNDEFIKAECKPLHEILGYAQARDLPKDEALKWVISANLHRRHLTAEQKRDVIAKLIKAAPEKSDRQIAATAKVSPTTVGAVRSTVQSGQLPEKRIGKDGKARKQPVKKKTKARKMRSERVGLQEHPREEEYVFELDLASLRQSWTHACTRARRAFITELGYEYREEVLTTQPVKAEQAREFVDAKLVGNDPGPIPECLLRVAK